MQKKRSHGWKKAVMHAGICLLLMLLGSKTGVYAQSKTLSVQWKDASLQQACQELETMAGIHFSYNENTLKLYGHAVTLSVKDASLKQVLDKLFAGSTVSYTQKGSLVVLTAVREAGTPGAKPGNHMLTGKVMDEETGKPLVQATVSIGKKMVLTGEDGSFRLALAEGSYEVQTSNIGYLVKTTPVTVVEDMQPVTIRLPKNTGSLNEIVVIGYGKQSRKMLTSSIATVQQEDFNKGSFNNPAQLLQGKVAGLQITRSGDPNGVPSVTLRGPSTLRTGAAQEPFYVIDDVPGADIRLVAPDDIASMDVLKDASATAIYGTRASNGVIIITTKKGRNGTQTQVGYNSYTTQEKVARKIKMMDAPERLAYLAKNNLASDPADLQNANTDWQKEVSQTAYSQNHHLSLSGSNKGMVYSATMNYFNSKGILKNTGINRLIARVNIEQKALNDNLKLGLAVASSTSNSDQLPDQDLVLYNMLRYLPTVPVLQANGSYSETPQRVQYYNPVSLQNNAWRDVKNKLTNINATAQVLLPYGFKYDLSLTTQAEQINSGTYYTSKYLLKSGFNGQAYRSAYENSKKIAETFLTFDKHLRNHNINVLAGYSWQEDKSGDGFQASNQNFATDELGYTNIGLGSPTGNYRNEWGDNIYQKLRLISFYGRANYNFKNRYLLQVSLRRDASSAFGANNRWGTFPAGSIAWRVINEGFMARQHVFSDLKLRAGYGITGNSLGFNPLISRVRYGAASTFYYNGSFINGIGTIQNANPDLKWEKTAMFNIGADFSVLKGRITGSFEYYNKKTTDLIWDYPVSTTQYYVSVYTANVGSISNKGFEFTLEATPVQTAAFKWITSFNLSHNQNKLVTLSNNKFKQDSLFQAYPGGQGQTGASVQILKAGFPVGQFFTFRYAGKNADGISQFYDSKGALTTAPKNFTDFFYAGNAQPKLLLGWGNTFTWKHLDVNIFLRSSLGGKVMNATLADLNRPLEVTAYNLPRFSASESAKDNGAYFYSDRYIENASYLRVDNITIGYTLTHLFKNGPFRTLRVYASGNNLAVITGYHGIDPEVNMGGLTPGVDNKNYYPRTRAFLFGLNVSL